MRVVLIASLLASVLTPCPAEPAADKPARPLESDELKQEPRQTRRLFESALRLEREGQTAAAITAFGELLQQFPNHQNGLRHRAQLLLQSGQLDGASHDLSALLLAHPDDGAAWSSYGDCLRALRQDKDAASAYQKATENGLNNAAANRKRGDALAAAGENESALESYSSAIKLRLDNPESYFVRGMLLIKLKRERDAIEDFSRAIEFNPHYAEASFNRGRAWGELRQFNDAVRDLSVYLRMKPGDGPALAYRGAALDTLGRVEEALSDYGGALKADADNPRVLTARAELYSRLGRHADALADRDRAVALEPLNAFYHMARGGSHLALGNYEQALADRTRAVELAPTRAMVWYSRATTYFTLGQPGNAVNDAVEALRQDPGFEPARKLIDEIQASGRLKLSTVLPSSEPQPLAPQPRTPSTGPPTAGAPIAPPVLRPPVESTAPAVRSSQQIAGTAPVPAPHSTGPRPPLAPAPKPTMAAAVEPVKPAASPKAADRSPAPPQQSAQLLYKAGLNLVREDQTTEAAAKLAQAAALDPSDPLIWNALGYCRMRQKNYKAALQALNKAIALNPRYRNAYRNRSAVKQLLGDGSGAARDRIQARLLTKRP